MKPGAEAEAAVENTLQNFINQGGYPNSLLDPNIELPQTPAQLESLINSTFGSGVNELNLGGGGGYAWMIGAALGAIIHMAISGRGK